MKFVLILSIGVVLSLAAAVSAQPPVAVDVSKVIKSYQVGPGDEITVTVVGEKDFDFVARVNEDGKLDVPFDEQPIGAKCKTERELRSDMKQMLAKYLRNPQFNLRVTQFDSRPPATIYGEVVNPQQVKLMRKATLVELLALAGGPKEEAGGMVQVFRTQAPVCTGGDADADWRINTADGSDVPSRIYSLASVRQGNEQSNPTIYPGDVIVVVKAAPVYITGEVISSQGIYLKEGGTTLSEAIAKVGGVRPGAKTKDIKIYRKGADSSRKEVIAVNLDQIRAGTQKDPVLEPYDEVVVDKAKDSLAKQIMNIAIGAAKGTVSSISGGIGYRVLY